MIRSDMIRSGMIRDGVYGENGECILTVDPEGCGECISTVDPEGLYCS